MIQANENYFISKNWQKWALHLVLAWWRPLTFRERLLTTMPSPGLSNYGYN